MEIRELARRFGEHPGVLAVALGGSRGAGSSDGRSDFDVYVYSPGEIALDFRRALAGHGAEIDNRFWEPGDEWRDESSGARFDVMFRNPTWIEDRLDAVLVRHEASIGYSTCLWYNVLHSEALFDPRGWYAALQARARAPYPEPLCRAILAKNYPLLRANQSSYRAQIEPALRRSDVVSVQHRVTALLASYFDAWFAIERQPHPGEKRLLAGLPPAEAALVRAVLDARGDAVLAAIDALLDDLDQRIGSIPLNGTIEHAAAWVTDLERARAFYERWFGAVAGEQYKSRTRDFTSYFMRLGTGTRLELMRSPTETPRAGHIAISVGSQGSVDAMIREMEANGVAILSRPRITGDGYYEAAIQDSEGNTLEIIV